MWRHPNEMKSKKSFFKFLVRMFPAGGFGHGTIPSMLHSSDMVTLWSSPMCENLDMIGFVLEKLGTKTLRMAESKAWLSE